jgi:subtilisin family serine protease
MKGLILCLLFAAMVVNVAAQPPTHAVDSYGNKRYMIFLDEAAANKEFSGLEAPARSPSDLANMIDLYGWHKPSTRALVHRLERSFGIKAIAMTSYAMPMFSAYLPDTVAEVLARHPDVAELAPVLENTIAFASPPWSEIQPGPGRVGIDDFIPWGKIAIGTNDSLSTETPVYLIDGGINSSNKHVDLRIIEYATINATPEFEVHPSHATHVAGILGAKMNTGRTRGVNSYAPIINVNRGGPYDDNFFQALDWVLGHAETHGIYAVANLSSVAAAPDGSPITVTRDKMAQYIRRMSSRVLVVQSAGNFYTDACAYAYPSANELDGILVVGGIDRFGLPVAPVDGNPGFDNRPFDNGVESNPGSNYGSCVEVWAPSKDILSTYWASDEPNNLTRIRYMSGTSMAAPHVAALAARFGNTSTTPVQREAYIRGKLVSTGYVMMPDYTQTLSQVVPSRLYATSVYASSTSANSSVSAVSDSLYLTPASFWNAGQNAPAWIEFDFGSQRCFTSIRLVPEQIPEGNTTHNIYVGDAYPLMAAAYVSAYGRTLEPFTRAIGSCGRYLRVETTGSSSYVAWREIEIYGS